MDFYNNNYEEFSKTRLSIWKSVRDFCSSIPSNSTCKILDAGCGNGKNMKYLTRTQPSAQVVGLDSCEKFVRLCHSQGLCVTVNNVTHIDYNSNTFEYILCIAVIHHLVHETERILALKELLRVLKVGGKLLVTVWAFETDNYSRKRKFSQGNNVVLFNHKPRYYYVYNKTSFQKLCDTVPCTKTIYWERGNWNAIFTKTE